MDAVLRKVQERIQNGFKRAGGGAKYFSTVRRGENAELHEDLNSADISRQKSAVKRIIASMTLGRDVNFFFVDVVKLGQTVNLELKKLVYLYVLNTAKLQPDKALMAVNTFLQDATSPSPIVRALAIRTMMCIRVESVLEYTMEPLRRAVSDPDPYVRKTAAIGIGKLFHHNMDVFYEQDFAAELLKLLNDSFAIVTANAAAVVGEVNDYGNVPFESDPEWVNRLLVLLGDCTEWGQQYVLDLLASLKPNDTETAEMVVARVLPRLSHTNPAVVMGAIKVIANYASRCQSESIERYTLRVNAALLTLARSDPETQYVVYRNIHALLVVFPNLLRNNLDAFYVRFTDPPYVKLQKLRLLLKLVTPATAMSIVKELTEYSTEVDLLFVEEVIRAVAALALKVDAVAPACAELLMQRIELRPELLPQVVTAAKNIVRKYPDLLLLEPLITQYGADNVAEEDAKVSVIWMLGEYSDFVENGPSLLQRFIDSLMEQEQSVQLATLSAVIKTFLRDPVTMEPTLHQVLELLASKSEDPDIRDRAFSYWRLLSRGIGVEEMKEIIHGHSAPVNVDHAFSDAMTMADLKKSINTAAVVFGKPFHAFLPPYGLSMEDVEDEEDEEIEEAFEVPQAGPSELPSVSSLPSVVNSTHHTDPLEDLFGHLPTANQADAAAAGGKERFAAPSGASPSPSSFAESRSPTDAAARTPLVVSSEQNHGVAIHAALVPGPILSLVFVNKAETAISNLELQINTNALGYLPKAFLRDIISSVAPHTTAEAVLPLQSSDEHVSLERLDLEVGVKSSLFGLQRFRVEVPAELFFPVDPPAVSRDAFIARWSGSAAAHEVQKPLTDIGGAMLAQAANVRATMERLHFGIVAQRDTPTQLAFYGHVCTAQGVHVLFELVLERAAPQQSVLTLRDTRAAQVQPIILEALRRAFLPVARSTAEATPAPAPQPAQSTLDDLFS